MRFFYVVNHWKGINIEADCLPLLSLSIRLVYLANPKPENNRQVNSPIGYILFIFHPMHWQPDTGPVSPITHGHWVTPQAEPSSKSRGVRILHFIIDPLFCVFWVVLRFVRILAKLLKTQQICVLFAYFAYFYNLFTYFLRISCIFPSYSFAYFFTYFWRFVSHFLRICFAYFFVYHHCAYFAYCIIFIAYFCKLHIFICIFYCYFGVSCISFAHFVVYIYCIFICIFYIFHIFYMIIFCIFCIF